MVEAAFDSGELSDEKIVALATAHAPKNSWVWNGAVRNLRNYGQKEYFSLLLELGKDYMRNHHVFRSIVSVNLKLHDLEPAEALMKGLTLATLAFSDDFVWGSLLKNNSFNKEYLLVIGETAQKQAVWERIFPRLDLKSFTKKELEELKEKAPGMLGIILKTKKFTRQEVLRNLADRIGATSSYLSYDQVAELLIKVCKLTPQERLVFARKMENRMILWEVVQKTCPRVKLSQDDLVALFIYGLSEKRKDVISRFSPETSESLASALAVAGDVVSLSLLGELIASRKVSKEVSLDLAQLVDWETVWVSLIDSGYFSYGEIVTMGGMIKAASHRRTYWIRACEALDLNLYSFDTLMQFGEGANDERAWKKITEALVDRRKE